MNHKGSKIWVGLAVAAVCSLTLTLITLTPPIVPGDWARLDADGHYVPPVINYAWPSYALQVALWLGMLGGLWLVARRCEPSVLLPLSAKWRRQMVDRACRSVSHARGVRISEMYAALTVITLLGFGLRLHTLDSLPLLIDEIGFAARASDILHGQPIPIFAPGHNGNPATYSWLLAGVMGLWGQNAFAMRLLSLVCGTLCIPAAYALGRAWWGRRIGLLAAAFLATYPAHVYFSHLALYNSVDPLFALLALPALARALRRRRLADYMMVGVLAGIAQYFYHGSRLLPVMMVVYVILEYRQRTKPLSINHLYLSYLPLSVYGEGGGGWGLWIDTKRLTINCRTRGLSPLFKLLCAFAALRLGVMFLSFALISLPRFAPLLLGGLPLTGNLEGVRLPSDLADNALRSLLAWVGQPDVSPFWLSSAPLLPLSALLAFGLGGIVCLRNWRDPRHIVLLLTLLLTTIFGGVIWAAAPLYVRYLTALPAIVLLVATGIRHAQKFIENIWRRGGSQTRLTRPYIELLLVALIVLHGIILSLQHPAEAFTRVPPELWEEDRLAREAAHLPAGKPAEFAVTSAFGAVERITVADYVAAYGQRRAVSVSPP